MNQKAARLIRQYTARIKDPTQRGATRVMLKTSWKAADHKERGKLRAILTRAR